MLFERVEPKFGSHETACTVWLTYHPLLWQRKKWRRGLRELLLRLEGGESTRERELIDLPQTNFLRQSLPKKSRSMWFLLLLRDLYACVIPCGERPSNDHCLSIVIQICKSLYLFYMPFLECHQWMDHYSTSNLYHMYLTGFIQGNIIGQIHIYWSLVGMRCSVYLSLWSSIIVFGIEPVLMI